MPFNVPPAVNYPSPLISQPSWLTRDPVEGDRYIPVDILWGTMGGAANCVSLQLWGNAPNTISQIVALNVDNSRCGADVIFIFPDTGQTLTIPAYESGLFPVLTGASTLFANSPNSQMEDETSFSILNFLPPPVSIPKSEFQSFEVFSAINVAAAGTTQIIAASESGTISGLNIIAAINSTAGYGAIVELIDGAGSVVWGSLVAGPIGGGTMALANLNDLQVRFVDGLSLSVVAFTALPTGGALSLNLYYRSP